MKLMKCMTKLKTISKIGPKWKNLIKTKPNDYLSLYFISTHYWYCSSPYSEAQSGVCYGRLGNNLPTPTEVVALYNQYNIRRMRIYDPNQQVLRIQSDTVFLSPLIKSIMILKVWIFTWYIICDHLCNLHILISIFL